MAACKQCGAQVGCGCHLNAEGLCGTCAQKKRIASLPKPVTPPNVPK